MSITQIIQAKLLLIATLLSLSALFLTPISVNAHSISMTFLEKETPDTSKSDINLQSHCTEKPLCTSLLALLNTSQFTPSLKPIQIDFIPHYSKLYFTPIKFDPPPPRYIS